MLTRIVKPHYNILYILMLTLQDTNTGELFASCPYDPNEYCVESVVDSSRYFVLRIVDQASGTTVPRFS
jgi:Protein of unknown function (DUF1681)